MPQKSGAGASILIKDWPRADGPPRKHDPYIVLNGTVGKVLVGKGAVTGHFEDPIHPMEDDRGTPSTTSKRFGWKIRRPDERRSKEIWRTTFSLLDTFGIMNF